MSITSTAGTDDTTAGLVLTGGGARAAYQVGVLKAIAQIRRECGAANPFPVITGTSAVAINAAALACRAADFDAGIQALCEVWQGFHAEQVYRSDSIGVIRTGARWLTMMEFLGPPSSQSVLRKFGVPRPRGGGRESPNCRREFGNGSEGSGVPRRSVGLKVKLRTVRHGLETHQR
jgi:predicted acylesterase/phospholipase RssA